MNIPKTLSQVYTTYKKGKDMVKKAAVIKIIYWFVLLFIGVAIIASVNSWVLEPIHFNYFRNTALSSVFYFIPILAFLIWGTYCVFKIFRAVPFATHIVVKNDTVQQASGSGINTKYCMNCGASLPSEATYCLKCGAKQIQP